MAKYHNFKKTASYYISKAGNNLNPGTDPNAPRLSPQSGSYTCVVGAGHYLWGGIASTSASRITLIGDGKVIIEGAQTTAGGVGDCQHITFLNWVSLNTRAGSWTDCTIINCPLNSTVADTYLMRCVVQGSTFAAGRAMRLRECVVLSCTGEVGGVTDSDVNADSELIFSGAWSNFYNNNYRGTLRVLMGDAVTYKYYAVKDPELHATGTPQDYGYASDISWLSEAQLVADGYTGTVTGLNAKLATCLNRPPKFNDAAGEDYTYRVDSPNIRRSSTGGNIGSKRVAASILNTDHGNEAGTKVAASPEIDSTNSSAYQLHAGAVEGYVDYLFRNGGLTLTNLNLKDLFTFNSDIAGGQIGNKNVPDAEPITSEYAPYTQTAAASPALNLLMVPAGKIAVGQHVWVMGNGREVLSKTSDGVNDTLTLSADLPAVAGAGVSVTFGNPFQLAAVNPNRLTVFMRTRSNPEPPSWPMVNADWDNELDALYGKAGYLFNQEIDSKPVLYIDGTNVYGGGDSDAPTGLAEQELAPEWVHLRVFKRNNYNHRGLPV